MCALQDSIPRLLGDKCIKTNREFPAEGRFARKDRQEVFLHYCWDRCGAPVIGIGSAMAAGKHGCDRAGDAPPRRRAQHSKGLMTLHVLRCRSRRYFIVGHEHRGGHRERLTTRTFRADVLLDAVSPSF